MLQTAGEDSFDSLTLAVLLTNGLSQVLGKTKG